MTSKPQGGRPNPFVGWRARGQPRASSATTTGGTRFHRCDRARQQLPLRTDSLARARDVRPARRPMAAQGHPPRAPGEPGSPDVLREESIEAIPSRLWQHIGSAPHGVDHRRCPKEHRTRKEGPTDRPRGRPPGGPPRSRAPRRWQHQRGIGSAIDLHPPIFGWRAGRTTARSASGRTIASCNGVQRRPKATSEGNRPREDRPSSTFNSARWYGPLRGAKPRGTACCRYDFERASGNGCAGGIADRQVAKSEEATSAVTRCGCEEGESSGGYELGAGNQRFHVSGSARRQRWRRSWGRLHVNGRRNASNPTIGSGMQQARDSSDGGNRRGREKRRGRSAIRAWQLGSEAVATPRVAPCRRGCR